MPRLLKDRETAAELGVSRAKLWEWVRQGRIGSVKIDGMRRFRREDIDAFVASLSDDQQRPASA
jgi:excisionase family DNA binding protein